MITYLYAWFLFGISCLVFELTSPGLFYFLSFAFGAIPAGVAAWLEMPFVWQGGIFFAGTAIAFGLLMLCVGKAARQDDVEKTNADALPGKKGRVIEPITPGMIGQVHVGGEVWSAQSELPHESLKKGTYIIVVRIEGIRLIVKQDPEYDTLLQLLQS